MGLKAHAFTSNSNGSDRRRSFALAREQLHTHGGIHQVAVERCGGDRNCFVAPERFWTLSLSVPDSRWDVSKPE
jgi:hypothetical protein